MGFFSAQACRTFLISAWWELVHPPITRWQPMQVWTEGMPGSGDTATE